MIFALLKVFTRYSKAELWKKNQTNKHKFSYFVYRKFAHHKHDPFYICTYLLRFNNSHHYVRNFTIGKTSNIELAIIESTLMSYLHPYNKKMKFKMITQSTV